MQEKIPRKKSCKEEDRKKLVEKERTYETLKYLYFTLEICQISKFSEEADTQTPIKASASDTFEKYEDKKVL